MAVLSTQGMRRTVFLGGTAMVGLDVFAQARETFRALLRPIGLADPVDVHPLIVRPECLERRKRRSI